MARMRSLGIDVSAGRGLDVVVLEAGRRQPILVLRRARREDLCALVPEHGPDVVCVDSPPSWGRAGGSRRAERDLARLAIHSYGTPAGARGDGHAFYAWMKEGHRVFAELARCGFPLYRAGTVRGTALEVFPHASAVVLAGMLPARGASKKEWRTSVLRDCRIATAPLTTLDLVDAALAALTGLLALRGDFTAVGEPDEGVIVVPVRPVPTAPYRRAEEPPRRDPQLALPGLSPCRCRPGCPARTSREFAPGHDARRKAALWEQTRRGQEAMAELRRRGWRLPPELG